MPLASTWLDLVVGIDLHLELVPGAPSPVPFPHPFVGTVDDGVGAVLAELRGGCPTASAEAAPGAKWTRLTPKFRRPKASPNLRLSRSSVEALNCSG